MSSRVSGMNRLEERFDFSQIGAISPSITDHGSSNDSQEGVSNKHFESLQGKIGEPAHSLYKFSNSDSDLIQNNLMISKVQRDSTLQGNAILECGQVPSWRSEKDSHFRELSEVLLDMVLESMLNDFLNVKVQQASETLTMESVLQHKVDEISSAHRLKKASIQRLSDEDTDEDESDSLQGNTILRHFPMDGFTKDVLEQVDTLYSRFKWKLNWHILRQTSLKRLFEEIACELGDTNVEFHGFAQAEVVSSEEIKRHPIYSDGKAPIFSRNINFSSLALKFHNQDTYQELLKEADSLLKTPKGRKSIQKTPVTSTSRKRGRKRKRQLDSPSAEETPITLPPILQKKKEVFIPTFTLIEETVQETIHEELETIENITDEYQDLLSSISKDGDLVILDLAGENYPYQIHLDRELKEKKRIWRCWNGGSFKDPEEMTPKELKAYEKKWKKAMPKMPEFKVEPESYLFSPVPTHNRIRGNFETMREKATAFWIKKREEDAKKLAEEEEKKNRKQRKRKYDLIYSQQASDDSGFEESDTSRRGRKRRKKSEPYNLRRQDIGTRERRMYTFDDEEDAETMFEDERQESDMEDVPPPEPIEQWMLVQNTGPQMTLRDALNGTARFMLKFKFLGMQNRKKY